MSRLWSKIGQHHKEKQKESKKLAAQILNNSMWASPKDVLVRFLSFLPKIRHRDQTSSSESTKPEGSTQRSGHLYENIRTQDSARSIQGDVGENLPNSRGARHEYRNIVTADKGKSVQGDLDAAAFDKLMNG